MAMRCEGPAAVACRPAAPASPPTTVRYGPQHARDPEETAGRPASGEHGMIANRRDPSRTGALPTRRFTGVIPQRRWRHFRWPHPHEDVLVPFFDRPIPIPRDGQNA